MERIPKSGAVWREGSLMTCSSGYLLYECPGMIMYRATRRSCGLMEAMFEDDAPCRDGTHLPKQNYRFGQNVDYIHVGLHLCISCSLFSDGFNCFNKIEDIDKFLEARKILRNHTPVIFKQWVWLEKGHVSISF